jgi:pimeloyl-ACP methyl ester carboxylesterase
MSQADMPPGRAFDGVPVRAPLDASWTMRRIALATGADLAFTWRGGAGLPLLFLTANRTSRRIFDFALARLDPFNPVAAPDYRGLGESTGPEVRDLDDHLDDIEDLCDALGWERFAVIGQATGATLALLLAARLPDRVVAGASPRAPRRWPRRPSARNGPRRSAGTGRTRRSRPRPTVGCAGATTCPRSSRRSARSAPTSGRAFA